MVPGVCTRVSNEGKINCELDEKLFECRTSVVFENPRGLEHVYLMTLKVNHSRPS
jgi:hypothetical protein